MIITNIKVGQIFKNYKDLCKALCIEPKGKAGSNSRKAQEKEIKRHLDYSKIEGSNKLMIDKIYNEVAEKKDGRKNNKGGNNKVFADDIEVLLLHLLKNSENETISISRGRLYKMLNMINENYIIGRNQIPKLSELVNLPKEVVYDFYDNSNTTLRNTVERNLKRLRNRALIMWEATTTVAVNDVFIPKDILDQPIIDKGELIHHIKPTHRLATNEEKKLILKCEKEAMNELGVYTLQDVFLSGNWKHFKNSVENKLKLLSNIQYYYDTYTITINTEDVSNECKLLDESQKTIVEKNINNNIIKSHLKSTKTRNTSSKNKLLNSFEDIKNKKKLELRASNNYIEINEQLAFTLIRDESENLFNIKKTN